MQRSFPGKKPKGLGRAQPSTPSPRRGTTLNPGPDLARMPVGIDLRGINLVEGVRAAVASAAILVANQWVGSHLLVIAAIAAQLTCFGDVGGSVRIRLPWLSVFTVLGALTWMGFGLLRGSPAVVILSAAAAFVLVASFFRVWGQAALAVGNLLTVVMALALDAPLDLPEALGIGGAFVGGGLWAIVVMLVIWRVQPDRPARRAIAEVWRLLAVMVGDLRGLVEAGERDRAGFEGHARAHRRAVRDAIERARAVALDTARARGPLSQRSALNLIRLEAADQLFGVLIALSDLFEHGGSAELREAGGKVLRLLRPSLLIVGQAVAAGRLERPQRLERAVVRMLAASAPVPDLARLVDAVASRLRTVAIVATGQEPARQDAAAGSAPVGVARVMLAQARANLTWRSAILRHAARAAVVAIPAVGVTLVWVGPFQHWLTITVILTMQPYFAATWQRALERIAGTLLGAAIGAALAFFPQTPAVTAALLFPLSVIGFSARQVSYGAFIACLTPLVVVLIEVVEPGQSEWFTAGMRMLFTFAGGLLAVASCLLLWPTWEPGRLKEELRATFDAYAGWADLTLAPDADAHPAAVNAARAAAGVAHNNLEASLSRALQEPRRKERQRLDSAMVADATLRRFGATLMALQYDPDALHRVDAARWRRWLTGALRALSDGRPAQPPGLEPAGSDLLRRMARQIELLNGAVGHLE